MVTGQKAEQKKFVVLVQYVDPSLRVPERLWLNICFLFVFSAPEPFDVLIREPGESPKSEHCEPLKL